jgi:single-strand DNA-binding protein
MFSNATLIGRLARDPEARYTNDGNMVTNFTVAIDSYKKGDSPDFLNCVAFGKLAELINNSLKKGNPIHVEARPHSVTWTDRDNIKRRDVQFIVSKMTFLESKNK